MEGIASSKRPRPADLDCPARDPKAAPRPSKRACAAPAPASPPTPPVLHTKPRLPPGLKLPAVGAAGGTEPAAVLTSFFRSRAAARPPYLCVSTPSGAAELEEEETDEEEGNRPVRAVHREVVVNWLMEVREAVGARWTTLALAVSLLDRFLAAAAVGVDVVQLLGVTCVFIACKHEEAVPTAVARLVDVCAGAIDGPRLLALERVVLNTLGFDLVARTPLSVLDYLCAAVAPADRAVRDTADFAARIALLDAKLACVRPAAVVLGALHLALAVVPAERGARSGGEVFAELAGVCGDDFVRKVAKRILRFWNHSVISHDVGNVNFLVRDQPIVAARIFPRDSAECLAVVYGVRVASTGAFVEWAAGHSIRDLLAA